MKRIFLLKILFFFLFVSYNSYATDYYVSFNTGSNSNDGSVSAPFATMQYAANFALPGDTIFVMNGTLNITSGTALNMIGSGTADQYITFKNYPGHTPKIRASGNVWNAIRLNGNYLVFDGFELEGNNANITYEAALQSYNNYLAGDRNWNLIANFNTNGIMIGGSNNESLFPHHVVVRNCKVHDFPGGGINSQQADYTTIDNNIVYNNAWYMMYAGSGISILTPTIFDNFTGYRNFVRNNISYGNKTTIPWAQLERLSDGNGIIIDVNITNNYPGRTLVENNVCYYNGGSGIHAYNAQHVDIINNTAYHNANIMTDYSEIYSNTGKDNNIINNIMYARPGGRVNSNNNNQNVTYNYNVYFNGTAAVVNTFDIVANPQFVNPAFDETADFKLKDISPAINSGTDQPGFFAVKDILGIPRPTGPKPDRGAYEFTGTPAAINSFTTGNIVVLKVGDGTTTLSNNATHVHLQEYTSDGSPTTMNVVLGSAETPVNSRIVLGGNSTTYEGQLQLSTDGRFLSAVGYDAEPGSDQPTHRGSEKAIVRVTYSGEKDYSTRLGNAFMNGAIRSAVTSDGNRYYFTGSNSSPASFNSTRFLPFGSPNTTNPTAFSGGYRALSMLKGQVYYTGFQALGMLTANPAQGNYADNAPLPGTNTPGHNYSSVTMLDMDPSSSFLTTGFDVMYLSDETRGLVKYYLDGSTWVLSGTFNPPSTTGITGGFFGVTARLNESGQPEIFAIKGSGSNNELLKLIDASGRMGNIGTANPSVASVAAAGANYMFRGLAFSPSQFAVLPINLLLFSGQLSGSSVALNWETSSERNAHSFEVEKSRDGNTFKVIENVLASNLESGAKYKFTDIKVQAGNNFYRLKSLDKDGTFTYSKTILIHAGMAVENKLKVFPNPVQNQCAVTYPEAGENATITILSADGKRLAAFNLGKGSTQRSLDVSTLPKGLYFMVFSDQKQVHNVRFLK